MPIKALLIALGLLTRLPVVVHPPPSAVVLGQSVLAYPLVGLLLGAVLAGLATVLPFEGVALQAALLLACWVWITGGLHLDGLADSVDAWVGGLGNRERTLEIMKDIHSGPMAIITLIVLLLIKFAAIQALLLANRAELLLLPPLLGRSGMLLLFLTLPYVRAQGMGAVAAAHLPKKWGWFLLSLTGGCCVFLYGQWGIEVVLCCLGVFFWLRLQMQRRMGGTTGDSTGARVREI